MVSDISRRCKNYGKYSGTSNYHICERCAAELEDGCAHFEIANIRKEKKEVTNEIYTGSN